MKAHTKGISLRFILSINLSIWIQHLQANNQGARKSNARLLPKIWGLQINLNLNHYKGNDRFQYYYEVTKYIHLFFTFK